MENGFTNPFAPKFSMTSLEKVLKNGVDGTEVAENGNAVMQKKREVVNDSLNPVWNQTFDFVVEDGLHDMLILEVWDHDTFGKDYMGRCILTLTRVILEGEYKETFQLDEAKSGRLNLHLKWMPQPIYRDRE
ncbi:Synaptotagmin-5 [Vitis vinifera]|uniref:Synaptotagmin-5 n=1 Tax=Vitis vinifera TaxID=29760 RepID=A0A438J889_VITVI|nr:Synaptotagmin-5 [Vitis vinifera]